MSWRNLMWWKRLGTRRPERTAETEEHSMLALQRDMNNVFEEFRRNWVWAEPFEPFGGDVETLDYAKVDVEESKKTRPPSRRGARVLKNRTSD